jgi:hypothetical protein
MIFGDFSQAHNNDIYITNSVIADLKIRKSRLNESADLASL